METMYKLKKKEKKENGQKMLKLIGLIAAFVSTAAIWIAMSADVNDILGEILCMIWLIGLVLGYVLGGGVKGAIGIAWKLAKFGWIIVPFPYDLMTGVMTLALAFLVFMLCPVLFVFLNFIKREEPVL